VYAWNAKSFTTYSSSGAPSASPTATLVTRVFSAKKTNEARRMAGSCLAIAGGPLVRPW